jgi:hypothetical protein
MTSSKFDTTLLSSATGMVVIERKDGKDAQPVETEPEAQAPGDFRTLDFTSLLYL